MVVCFICMGTQGRTLIDINHPLSNYDESTYKLNIKIEYKYIQSNIVIVSAAYLIFLDKESAKKKVSTHGWLMTIFISSGWWIGN